MLGAEVWAFASEPLAVLFWPQFWLRKMANKYVLNCSARCLYALHIFHLHINPARYRWPHFSGEETALKMEQPR